MNGYDLGRYVGAQIIGLIITAIVFGFIAGIGLYVGIGWMVEHVSVVVN